MHTPSAKSNRFQTPEDKERFFQILEDDPQLFKETLEVLLNLAVSDPKLTFQVADMIESDFRNIYLVIMKKIVAEKGSTATMGCCKDL
jgi:hypothetical protein